MQTLKHSLLNKIKYIRIMEKKTKVLKLLRDF